jgi:hypothetical protein
MVAIVMETMTAVVAAPAIKEFGHLSICLVFLYLGHHLSLPIQKNLEATMPLMMPLVWGVIFSMHLLNSQQTQVVCC